MCSSLPWASSVNRPPAWKRRWNSGLPLKNFPVTLSLPLERLQAVLPFKVCQSLLCLCIPGRKRWLLLSTDSQWKWLTNFCEKTPLCQKSSKYKPRSLLPSQNAQVKPPSQSFPFTSSSLPFSITQSLAVSYSSFTAQLQCHLLCEVFLFTFPHSPLLGAELLPLEADGTCTSLPNTIQSYSL